ncbi:MAG: hypothetical protein PHY42_05835, partial [Bacilli bacterium]|nr:hypothetical protein [Bacilli bacterium]
DMALFGDAEIEFVDLTVEEWTETELSSLFYAAKILSTTDFANFGSIEDATIDSLAHHLANSKFITNSLNPILDVYLDDMALFGDAEIEFVDLTVEEWTETELSSLFYAAKILSTTDFANFGAVEDATIDSLAHHLANSKFIKTSLNPILDVYLDDMGLFGNTETDFVELSIAEWTEDELTHLFYAAKLLSTQDMSNIGTLSDEVIEDMSYHMANSLFITRNLNTLMDSFLGDMDTGTMSLEFGTVDNWSDPVAAEIELNAIFKSAKIISAKGNSTDAFLDLTEEELDIFLSSELISETLVNLLITTSEPGKELDFLVGVNDQDVPWYDGDKVDTTHTLNGTIMTIAAPANTTKFNLYADGVKVASTRELTYDLSTITVENPTPQWTVQAYNEGELRKIFTAMGALASSLGGEGGFTTDTITTLTDEDIDNIIVSNILVQSIVVLLEDMASEVNPFIVIPEGDLKSIDPATKLAAWKNNGTDGIVVEGELSKLFKGLRRFLQGNTIESFDMTTITGLSDDDIYEMLKSDVLSESIIVQIEAQADPIDPESIIAIPTNVGLDDPSDRSVWLNVYTLDEYGRYTYDGFGHVIVTSDGELTRCLKAMKIILNGSDISQIDIGNILDETNQNIVLASLVIEETIIKKVEDEASKVDAVLTIPYAIEQDRSLWKGQYGELRALLNALDYVLGEGGSITNFNFDLDVVIEEKDEILKSLVISETIITKIKEQTSIYIPVGSGYGLVSDTDRSAWLNVYPRTLDGNYQYDINDDVIIMTYGELSLLLDAIDIIVPVDPISGERSLETISFDIGELFDPINRPTFLKSLVISETIVHQIYSTAETSTSLYVPGTMYLNALDDASEFNRDKWFNVYDGDTLTLKGEIDYLLDAADLVLGEGASFDSITFDVGIAFDSVKQATLLRSLVISETMVQKIVEEANKLGSMLALPGANYVNDISLEQSRNKWFNDYSGETVVEHELAHLLNATSKVTTGSDFANLSFDLNAAFDATNQPIILRSYIISETILQKIVEETNNPASMLSLPPNTYLEDPSLTGREGWYNKYDASGNVTETHELAHLLNATNILLAGGSFEDVSFDLNAAFNATNQPIILRSYIISETILQKIVAETNNPASMLSLPPSTYLEDPSLTGREGWYNKYDASGNVTETHELAHLLNATNILLAGGSFENVSFDLSAAFSEVNQPTVLKSYVIAETILQKIVIEANNPASMLELPPSGYLDDPSSELRDNWYNEYDVNGTLSQTHELAHLLTAANFVLDGGTFENMGFNLSAAFDSEKQPTILRSYVIAETIMQRIIDETTNPSSMLSLPPAGYLNDPSLTDRSTWYNTYDVNGDVTDTQEIAHVLNATNILLGGGDFTNVSFDLSAAFDDDNQKVILKSYIISETILQRIVEETEKPTPALYLAPTPYLDDVDTVQRTTWYNTYDEAGDLATKKELANLLEACEIILGGDSFDELTTFDISVAFDPANQEILLKSFVISETFVQSIYQESQTGAFELPSETYLENPNTSTLRSTWYNQYTGAGVLLQTKEIAHLLNAAKEILPAGSNFTGMDFNLEKLFIQEKQDKVLKSYVFAETIISKIYEQDGIAVNVPINDLNGSSLSNKGNRSPWFNVYDGDIVDTYGEIAYMLSATNTILGGSGTFETMAFEMNDLFDDAKQAVILRSLVLSETIVQKIFDQNDTITSMPTVDLVNRPLQDATNRSAWYNVYSGESIVENEIAKFLDSVELIVGEGSFETMGAIDIDTILGLTFVLNHNSDFYVTESDFATLVNSIVMENLIAPLVLDIAENAMLDYLTVPNDGYHFYKKDLITNYDPATFNGNLYDLQGFLESLYVMNQADIDYDDLANTNILTFNDTTAATFAKAMVISRVFKGSIEQMFNTMLYPTYNTMPAQIPVSIMPPIIYYKYDWDDVKFLQTDYDDETRLVSYNNLVAKLAALKETETVNGYDIPTAFYHL